MVESALRAVGPELEPPSIAHDVLPDAVLCPPHLVFGGWGVSSIYGAWACSAVRGRLNRNEPVEACEAREPTVRCRQPAAV